MATNTKARISAVGVKAIEAITEILRERTKGMDVPNVHWVGGGDASDSYCRECCLQEVEELKAAGEDVYIDGGWGSSESDGGETCEKCGKILNYSLTKYGIESELNHFEEHGISDSQDDAYCFLQVIEAGGGDPDIFPDEAKRVAKIARKFIRNHKRITP